LSFTEAIIVFLLKAIEVYADPDERNTPDQRIDSNHLIIKLDSIHSYTEIAVINHNTAAKHVTFHNTQPFHSKISQIDALPGGSSAHFKKLLSCLSLPTLLSVLTVQSLLT
jgi:hypothetical protein